MSEPAQQPRETAIEIASAAELRQGLAHTLRHQGYQFNMKQGRDSADGYRAPATFIDFEAWKPENPEQSRLVIVVAAGTADAGTIGTALACLSWYREHHGATDTQAWVVAKAFSPGAWYGAMACPDLTLKCYRVALSIEDALGYTPQS
jgi:hypothetical protein